MTTGIQFFRASVGIAVLNSAEQILALERYELPGAWQLPQGGLDEGEEPADAARRELREETGIEWEQVELLGDAMPKARLALVGRDARGSALGATMARVGPLSRGRDRYFLTRIPPRPCRHPGLALDAHANLTERQLVGRAARPTAATR